MQLTSQPCVDEYEDIFVGSGEMATLMRQHDWASTSLGPPSNWPHALKVAVRLLLTSKFEMWLGWGPDIAFLYNDAYRPTLGDKHPDSLAKPTRVLWSEIWAEVEPRLRLVYEKGEATWDRGLQLILNRHGYPEETYHTFSYSPLLGDTGTVEGVFCAVTEETERVISERRLASLQGLASGLANAETTSAVFDAVGLALEQNQRDMPFCVIYLFDGARHARLACTAGLHRDHPHAPAYVALDQAVTWDLRSVWDGVATTLLDLSCLQDIPCGEWMRPPSTAALIPLLGQGTERPLGAMVVGLNPFRPADKDYLSFLDLFAGQIASRLASVQVYEAERQRSAALAEALRMRQEAADALRQANARLTSEIEQRTQERDRLRSLFQQAPSFMCLLRGERHVFELVNDAYLQLVGHRDLIGRSVREALPEVEGQGFFELLDNVYQTGQPFTGRNLGVQLQRDPRGVLEQRYIHLVYQPILRADGTVDGIFVDGYDVTHQKHAEEALHALNGTLEQRVAQRTQELADALDRLQRESTEREAAQRALRQAQKMEALGKLTGGVAHDFNNLLQVVSGNLQLLAGELQGKDRALQRVQNALSGVERGAKLASQLLAFGRRQPLEPKVVNIGRFVRSMDDMLRRAIGEEVEVETVIAGGLWNTLVDAGQTENAILNLAINARDAMNGRGRLTIEASNAMLDDEYARLHGDEDIHPGQYVLLAVSDTGEGIPPHLIDRVFEPFFSTKPEGQGTGLGLSMVYGFVKQSGGHIKIYSELGEGTTVKIYLPRAIEAEDVVADTAPAPVRGGSETVLVVEDDEAVRDTAVALLADLGYVVLKAKDASSALTVIDSGVPIDLLFTDVVMPGPLRSPELARKARERLPNISVLFTSGYTENSIVHGGRLDPGVELLSKPYTREALARKVRHVLGNDAQRRSAAAQSASFAATRILSEGARWSTPSGATVLFVEDDCLIRDTTTELLRHEGYRVLNAADAGTALRKLSEHRVDVLLADVGLPGTSGTALAQQARQQQPDIAIVFATGDYAASWSEGLGGAVLLMKPYEASELYEAVRKALQVRLNCPSRDLI
ncbi:response regulator [Eleftheria terrae]|uniref:hybrid sensor histidine kinase/response regulator n=1 Tax=Eleftheria terrae TaxID=1597781 RepID=UPI003F4DE758